MDQREYLEFLWRSGLFWTPGQETNNVVYADLDGLAREPGHHLVREATRAFQSSDANFGIISHDEPPRGHSRAIIADGDVGPVTQLMATIPRCGLPDWTPPEGMELGINDPDLAAAVESMREFATGSGSWPVPGCDPDRPNRAIEHSVRANVDTSGASSHQKSVLDEVMKRVERCDAQIGMHIRHIMNGDPANAEHDIRFQPIPGGTIGFAYFPKPGTCNQTVAARIDSTYNADVTMLSVLWLHEAFGHSHNLRHSNSGIMNPSILRINPLTWIGDPHESTMRRYFGGEPIQTSPPTEPPEPQPPGGHNGVFVYKPATDWPAGESRVLKITVE